MFLSFLSRNSNRIKMASTNVLEALEKKAAAAEQLLSFLKTEIAAIEKRQAFGSSDSQVARLKEENAALKREIEEWKKRLISAEQKLGVKQVASPAIATVSSSTVSAAVEPPQPEKSAPQSKGTSSAPATKAKESKPKKESKPAAESQNKEAEGDGLPVDVGRLDLRVGKIIAAKKHPDADALYVEEIDVGESKPRTVVSGLVKYVPLDEMQGRMVVVLCNLKPAKMRGITSEAMVMCASTPEKVEILNPPGGAVPGDVVDCEEYPRKPDAQLNPKKKIWETVAPDLKTNDQRAAVYKNAVLIVKGKGPITSPSLTGVQVK